MPAPASRLADLAGVCYGGGYATPENVPVVFGALGVRHARIGQVKPEQTPLVAALAAAGVDTCRILTPGDDQGLRQALQVLRDGNLRYLEAGKNEEQAQDLSPQDWPLARRTALLGNARSVRALRDLARMPVPVLAPALALKGDGAAWYDVLAQAGTLAGVVDAWNVHNYRGGQDPSVVEGRLDEVASAGERLTGTPAGVVTETGWHNESRVARGEHIYTPENVAAHYLPRVLLDADRRGVPTYFYEAVDDARAAGRALHEGKFGLLRADLTAKPAGLALRRMMDLYGSLPGATSTIAVEVLTEVPGMRVALHGRADGSALLSLYLPVSVYDERSREARLEVPVPVRVAVPRRRSLSLLEVSTGVVTPLEREADGAVTVPVSGLPRVLLLGVRT